MIELIILLQVHAFIGLVAIGNEHNLLSMNLVNFPIFWGRRGGRFMGFMNYNYNYLYNFSYRMLAKNTGKYLLWHTEFFMMYPSLFFSQGVMLLAKFKENVHLLHWHISPFSVIKFKFWKH